MHIGHLSSHKLYSSNIELIFSQSFSLSTKKPVKYKYSLIFKYSSFSLKNTLCSLRIALSKMFKVLFFLFLISMIAAIKIIIGMNRYVQNSRHGLRIIYLIRILINDNIFLNNIVFTFFYD